jgi:starch synthase (maltosyl-transferring)
MRYQQRVADIEHGQRGTVSRDAPSERAVARRVPLPAERPPRVVIEDPQPVVDGGRYRAKRCVGDRVEVSGTIVRDGHDILRALAHYRRRGERRWHTVPMARTDEAVGGDRWAGAFDVDALGRWEWQIEAFTDHFATWADELQRKLAAGETDLASELAEGSAILEAAAERAKGGDRARILKVVERVRDGRRSVEERCRAALEPALADAVAARPDRSDAAHGPVVELDVERLRARFGSWYELFPRSWGGFAGVERTLPQFAALGIDVLYFPPIHPIGVTARKGPNDAPTAAPGDPGSPWAIGSKEGGHIAVHPELGTIVDFDNLVAAAGREGLEIALDFAIQCSADHPWLTEHPEWFRRRPDGTLKYAENPPKRYRDIYNVDFDCEDWRGLWSALRDIVLYWISHGVHIFRVDNPHTKPFAFWEWLIESVRAVDPAVVFLSEAFTRETKMRTLAKLGFSQSYTYFTWKNTRWELSEYVRELATPPTPEYFRPNFFVNTPDILSDYLQTSGPAGFAARLVLAATLSPSFGVYSGFERFEATPRHAGSEEYQDSEKYEIKKRTLDGPLLGLLGRLNEIRRDHPALTRFQNVTFLETANDVLLGYAKQEGSDTVIFVVAIDPRHPQEGVLSVPAELGLPPSFAVRDLLSGERYEWRRGGNYVRLDPAVTVAHALAVVA